MAVPGKRIVAPDVSRDERTDEREGERASRGGSLRLANGGAPSEPRREMRACRSEFDPRRQSRLPKLLPDTVYGCILDLPGRGWCEAFTCRYAADGMRVSMLYPLLPAPTDLRRVFLPRRCTAMACTMQVVRWLLVVILAWFTGWSLVLFLVVDPLAMSLHSFLASALAFATLPAIGLLFRRWMMPLAITVALVVFVTGYWVMTLRALAMPDPRAVPEITRSEADPGLGHIAVVYCNSRGAFSVQPHRMDQPVQRIRCSGHPVCPHACPSDLSFPVAQRVSQGGDESTSRVPRPDASLA